MPLTSEEDHAFRFLVKVAIESIPSLNQKDLCFPKEEPIKFPAVAALDLGIVPLSVQENFVKALFFEIRVASVLWDVCWMQYYNEIAASAENYVKFVLRSCLLIYGAREPFYVKFLDIFGMVSVFAFRFSGDSRSPPGYPELDYHVYTAPILMVFYKKFVRSDFCGAGGWEGLDRHLRTLNYLRWYHLKSDVHRSDVRFDLMRDVFWRRKGKSYKDEIRFVSAYETLNDSLCQAMAEQVLALDMSTCDRPEDVEMERFVTAEDSAHRESLPRQQESVVLEDDEEPIEPIVVEEAIGKMAILKNQKGFETTMLQALETLINTIEFKMTEVFEASTHLEDLYKDAEESGRKRNR